MPTFLEHFEGLECKYGCALNKMKLTRNGYEISWIHIVCKEMQLKNKPPQSDIMSKSLFSGTQW